MATNKANYTDFMQHKPVCGECENYGNCRDVWLTRRDETACPAFTPNMGGGNRTVPDCGDGGKV